jgi:hypothetical protein
MSHKNAIEHFPNQPIHGQRTVHRCTTCRHPGGVNRKAAGSKKSCNCACHIRKES